VSAFASRRAVGSTYRASVVPSELDERRQSPVLADQQLVHFVARDSGA